MNDKAKVFSIPLTDHQNKVLVNAFKKAGLKVSDEGLAIPVERNDPSVGWDVLIRSDAV